MSFVAKYDLVYVSGKKQAQILQQKYNCEGQLCCPHWI